MSTLTGKQVKKIVEIFEDTPSKKVQEIIESGLFTDLRDFADVKKINRDEFRKLGGLELLSQKNDFLELISGEENIVIGFVDGTEILARAIDVFTYIDFNFANQKIDEPGSATPRTPVRVYRLLKNATFRQMFGSFGDLNTLCLTQAQIKAFAKDHYQWLRKNGYVTFFLFKSHNNLFVADVDVDSGNDLHVRVRRFEEGLVWNAVYSACIVIP